MTADAYLPVTVYDLPAHVAFEPNGRLRSNYAHAVMLGVARVIAGPTHFHVVVDIRRPYRRPAFLTEGGQ